MNNAASPKPGRILMQLIAAIQALAIAGMLLLLWNQPEPSSTARAAVGPAGVMDTGEQKASETDAIATNADPARRDLAARRSGAPVVAPLAQESAPRSHEVAPAESPVPPIEGVVLTGRIVDPEGRGIYPSSLRLYVDEAERPQTTVQAARTGHYATAGLAPGKYRLQVGASGFKQWEEELVLLPSDDVVQREFRLERPWILALNIITPEGEPLSQAIAGQGLLRLRELSAMATTWEPEGALFATMGFDSEVGLPRWVSAQGPSFSSRSAVVKQGYAGHFELSERRALWISVLIGNEMIAKARVEAGQAELVMEVPTERVREKLASVKLRVIDAQTREPVASARVGIWPQSMFGPGSAVDAEGRFQKEGLLPGLYRLYIKTEQVAVPTRSIRVEPGKNIDLGDIELRAWVDIHVRCEGVQGNAESLQVEAFPLDHPSHTALESKAESLSSGKAEFDCKLPEGRYLLRAAGAGAGTKEIDTRTVGQQSVILSLGAEAALKIVFVSPDDCCHVALADTHGRAIAAHWLRANTPRTWKVPAGEVRLRITSRSGESSERLLVVPEAGLELRLPE